MNRHVENWMDIYIEVKAKDMTIKKTQTPKIEKLSVLTPVLFTFGK